MILEPECRYGHGLLQKIKTEPENYWGLFGTILKRASAGSAVGQPLASLEPNSKVFTLTGFRCSTCGYMELFDEGADVE